MERRAGGCVNDVLVVVFDQEYCSHATAAVRSSGFRVGVLVLARIDFKCPLVQKEDIARE